jgi:hypothetical protein
MVQPAKKEKENSKIPLEKQHRGGGAQGGPAPFTPMSNGLIVLFASFVIIIM